MHSFGIFFGKVIPQSLRGGIPPGLTHFRLWWGKIDHNILCYSIVRSDLDNQEVEL